MEYEVQNRKRLIHDNQKEKKSKRKTKSEVSLTSLKLSTLKSNNEIANMNNKRLNNVDIQKNIELNKKLKIMSSKSELISSDVSNNVISSEDNFKNISDFYNHDKEYNEWGDNIMEGDDKEIDSYEEYSSDDSETDEYETESEEEEEEKVYIDEDGIDFADKLHPALNEKKVNSDYVFALLSDRPVKWDIILYSNLHASWKTYFKKSNKDTDWIEPTKVFFRPHIYNTIRDKKIIIKFNKDYFFDENIFFAYLKLSIKLISQAEYEELLNPIAPSAINSTIQKNVYNNMTFNKAIDLAFDYLGPSAVPDELIMRNAEYNEIYFDITSSITNRSGLNIYICGFSGLGKSMVVGRIVKELAKFIENGVSYTPTYLLNDNIEDKFQIVRLLGTTFSNSLELYFEIARQLGICSNEDSESEAIKLKVINRFKNNSKKIPMTLLIIDEIDRLHANITRELLLVSSSTDNSSSLILVGIANIANFTDNLGVCNVKKIVFQTYNHSHLSDILKQRMFGLINTKCADFVARKIEKNLNCDVRKLLDIGNQLLTNAIKNKEKENSAIDWKDELVNETTIDNFILLKDTVYILGENGLASQRISTIINLQSPKLRSFLVSLVVSRLCTSSGATLSEMLNAYNTYAEEKNMNIMNKDQMKNEMVEPLLCYHLIENHSNNIRFNKKRIDPDKVRYSVGVKARDLLNATSLESLHKSALESIIEIEKREKENN